MFRRIYSLVIKEFIHLRNDWWMPVFMVFGGALELLLIGWATSRPITNLPLMILDQDNSAVSREIVSLIENTGTFIINNNVSDMEVIETAIEKGDIYVAVVFPPDFSTDPERSTISLLGSA